MRIVFNCIILISFLSINTVAQNLVSNPGFEENTGCPEKNGDIKKCISWSTTAPGSTPDYFHSCYQKGKVPGTEIGVPENSEGYRNPVSGEAYMGLALYFKKNYYTREYIQNSLLQPLEKGVKYKISFYISLSDSSEFISDHIAVGFSAMPNGMLANAPELLQTARHLVTIKNTAALSTRRWTKVEAEYIAYGGEEYMIVGSFRANMTIKEFKKKIKKPALKCVNNECAAYYYVDDFSLSVAPSDKVNPKFK
jgi:OOP family OmpA-OmpF porin